jgi:hypothetical protein
MTASIIRVWVLANAFYSDSTVGVEDSKVERSAASSRRVCHDLRSGVVIPIRVVRLGKLLV